MRLNPALDAVGDEHSFYYVAKAREVSEKRGMRVISFGAGQPDFDTPSHIKDAAKHALDSGFTGYTEAAGIIELRRAIAEYLNQSYGANVSEKNVLVTTGGKTSIFLAIAAVAYPGSKIIIPEPSFYAYSPVARFFGAKPVFVPLRWSSEHGFELDVNMVVEKITENTSAIIVNSPHNPTGAVFEKQDVKRLFDEASSRGIAVISDEVYDQLVYDGEFFSITSIDGWTENGVLVHSFSKTFSMTGWRLGYLVAQERVIEKLTSLAVIVYSCAPSFVQKAGVAALKGSWKPVAEMIREFNERRKLMFRLLKEVPGFDVAMPKGAFYMFPRVKRALDALGMDVTTFANTLLEEKGVLVLPGTMFPDKAGKEFVRLSYSVSRESIVEGVERIKEFIEERL
uniref:Aminotransferase n=1 Tax=Fervidicoccus fontis TaxID=683846 RepID=A0A7J3ZLV6_9CREN